MQPEHRRSGPGPVHSLPAAEAETRSKLGIAFNGGALVSMITVLSNVGGMVPGYALTSVGQTGGSFRGGGPHGMLDVLLGLLTKVLARLEVDGQRSMLLALSFGDARRAGGMRVAAVLAHVAFSGRRDGCVPGMTSIVSPC